MFKWVFFSLLFWMFFWTRGTLGYADIDLGLFRLKFPVDHQGGGEVLRNEETGGGYSHKNFSKIFNVATKNRAEWIRNFYTIRFVVDPSRIMLDSGDVIRLAGLMETDELISFRNKEPEALKSVEDLAILSMDFLELYLKDRKLKVRYHENGIVDGHGDRLAYVYTDSGEFVNMMVLQAGFAVLSSQYATRYYPAFKEGERMARIQQRGIWR